MAITLLATQSLNQFFNLYTLLIDLTELTRTLNEQSDVCMSDEYVKADPAPLYFTPSILHCRQDYQAKDAKDAIYNV